MCVRYFSKGRRCEEGCRNKWERHIEKCKDATDDMDHCIVLWETQVESYEGLCQSCLISRAVKAGKPKEEVHVSIKLVQLYPEIYGELEDDVMAFIISSS